MKNKKTKILRIRCCEDTFIRFKKLAAEDNTYEDTLLKLIRMGENYPSLLKRHVL